MLTEEFEWDTKGDHSLLDFVPDDQIDDPHRGEVLVLSKTTEGGRTAFMQSWHAAEAVRPVPGPKKIKFSKEPKSAKVELATDLEAEEDAFADGYCLEFPTYVLYWAYRHLSKAARTVDSSLYHDFVSRIADEGVKEVIVAKSKSSAMRR